MDFMILRKMSANELRHHGILGQKWGVRRFENKDGTLTPEGKERYYGGKKVRSKLHLTDRQKKYLKIGAAVCGTALVAYGAYKLSQTSGLSDAGKIGLGGSMDIPFGRVDPKQMPVSQMLEQCNPNYALGEQWKHNCGGTTIAFEMIQQGFDVQAMPNVDGMSVEHMGRFITDLKSDSITALEGLQELSTDSADLYDRILRSGRPSRADLLEIAQRGQTVERIMKDNLLKAHPDGSRGNMFLHMAGERNHWISWSIQDGQVNFFNPQNAKENLLPYFGMIRSDTGTRAIRLDNVHFNMDTIQEVVADAKRDLRSASQAFNAFVEYGDGFVMQR